ncbi:hypothetical protein PGT21_020115 [Puccinia graminis f. sp. tritici]|uniref:Uncharacterized protein n=1 Tax=Puccinia graminis f. sp. tritici TaxID=56615 RepID=A0A5B0QB90_PUCGR|nr:hypothetical protein PGT21_018574 [Puccinia graminis f. sp. tritici]KAA1110389.1 hypothetical protein PGT21_020115 [Puccinia graminis f. sp. tritici]KAA1125513.1 hypothetical protein PGTUg99_012031 [Puccinia graminis f. sp. tritici]
MMRWTQRSPLGGRLWRGEGICTTHNLVDCASLGYDRSSPGYNDQREYINRRAGLHIICWANRSAIHSFNARGML